MSSPRTSKLRYLVERHIKVLLADKSGLFFSLLSSIILLFLYMTFLRGVYIRSLTSMIPAFSLLKPAVLNGFIAGWLISSILSETCVTVAFCINTIVITDRLNFTFRDFCVTPVKRWTIAFSYFIGIFIITCVMMFILVGVGFIYIFAEGWYLDPPDIVLILVNILLTSLFGSLLASLCEYPLTTSGSASGVATLVSSLYGFLCGAYIPVGLFGKNVQVIISLFPGTYGTVLFRKLFLGGPLRKIAEVFPQNAIREISDSFDYNTYFAGNNISQTTCFIVFSGTILLLIVCYSFLVAKTSENHSV